LEFEVPTTKKAVTVYFDDHLYERVVAAAKADRRSVANFVEAACDAVAPHVLGMPVALATRIEWPPVFEQFQHGTRNTRGEIIVWASRGYERQRFDIPREVLSDYVGDFKMSDAIDFCEQHRTKIEAACRQAWTLAPANGGPIMLTANDFQ
jgi:hypothetical protein